MCSLQRESIHYTILQSVALPVPGKTNSPPLNKKNEINGRVQTVVSQCSRIAAPEVKDGEVIEQLIERETTSIQHFNENTNSRSSL